MENFSPSYIHTPTPTLQRAWLFPVPDNIILSVCVCLVRWPVDTKSTHERQMSKQRSQRRSSEQCVVRPNLFATCTMQVAAEWECSSRALRAYYQASIQFYTSGKNKLFSFSKQRPAVWSKNYQPNPLLPLTSKQYVTSV